MDYTIHVTHDGRSYNADVRPQEKADQLLLRALHHFDIDPGHKSHWTLARHAVEDPEEARLKLDRSIAGQLDNGDRVELRPRNGGRREPSTGSY